MCVRVYYGLILFIGFRQTATSQVGLRNRLKKGSIMQCQSKVLVWLQKHCSVPAHSHSKVVKYCSFVEASAVSEICTRFSFFITAWCTRQYWGNSVTPSSYMKSTLLTHVTVFVLKGKLSSQCSFILWLLCLGVIFSCPAGGWGTMVALGQNMLSSARLLAKIAQTTAQLHQRLQCKVLADSQ